MSGCVDSTSATAAAAAPFTATLDIGFCTPDINLNINAPTDWMDWATGQAWLYCASGLYQTASPPPGQGVPWGSLRRRPCRHVHQAPANEIEFLLDGESQGMIALPPPGIPLGCLTQRSRLKILT